MSKKPTLIAYTVKERGRGPESHLDSDRRRLAGTAAGLASLSSSIPCR
jgi:hypothetical protein